MNLWHANVDGNWWEPQAWLSGIRKAEFRFDRTDRFVYYRRDDGTACIVDFRGSADCDTLIIPELVDDHPVTCINTAHNTDSDDAGYAFDPRTVILPDSVRYIADDAFSGFPNLEQIRLPEGLLHIGNQAFASCPLREIHIPDSVSFIGTGAFRLCSNLVSVALPKALAQLNPVAFFECDSLRDVYCPEALTEIGSYAFASCRSLRNVGLSHFLAKVGQCAFADCTVLETLHIPRSARHVACNAFDRCPNLTVSTPLGSFTESLCRKEKIPCITTD